MKEPQYYYVDTDVSGGTGDGSSWANAFDSLTDFAALNLNMGTVGADVVCLCRGTTADSISTSVSFDDWTPSANYTVTVQCDPSNYHGGVWNDSCYHMYVGNDLDGIWPNDYMVIDGLQIYSSGLTDSGGYHGIRMDGDHVTAKNCIVKDFKCTTDGGYGNGIVFYENSEHEIVYNCIVYNCKRGVRVLFPAGTDYPQLLNCTIADCSQYGIYLRVLSGDAIKLRNLVLDNAEYFVRDTGGTFDTGYIFTDDASAPEEDDTSQGNCTFHFETDTYLLSTTDDGSFEGESQSSIFTDDIKSSSTTRSDWDAGANEIGVEALASTANASISTAATIGVTRELSGASTITAGGSASLSVGVSLASTAAGSVSVSAALSVMRELSGAVTIIPSSAASLGLTRPFSGAVTITPASNASMSVTRKLSGASVVQAGATATLTLSATETLASTANASVSVSGELTRTVGLSSNAAASVSVSGLLEVRKELGSTASASVTTNASLEVSHELSGSVEMQPNSTAGLSVVHTLSGQVTIQGSANALLTTEGEVSLHSVANATTSVTGSIEAVKELSGAAAIAPSASGELSVCRRIASSASASTITVGIIKRTAGIGSEASAVTLTGGQVRIAKLFSSTAPASVQVTGVITRRAWLSSSAGASVSTAGILTMLLGLSANADASIETNAELSMGYSLNGSVVVIPECVASLAAPHTQNVVITMLMNSMR